MHTTPGAEVTSSTDLASALITATTRTLESLHATTMQDWRIPRVYAGHEVGADVRADLIFTLGHLADAGVKEIANRPLDATINHLLENVSGRATHTFFSYRIAETLLRKGIFEDNPLLEGLTTQQRNEVALACDSSEWIELLDAGVLPRNYAGVLARCEFARHKLGLLDDAGVVESLVGRLRGVLNANPLYMLDDSNDFVGRYDIYTADVWLFCETLSPLLGELWRNGMQSALELVDAVAGPDGSAIPWGRSTGVLSSALTIELAALAIASDLVPERSSSWVRKGLDALRHIERSFDANGVANSHRYKNQDRYRGPERRLQLTLDVLGKLAWAAVLLKDADQVTSAKASETYEFIDSFVPFESDRNPGVWIHRSPGARFSVPFVGTTRSHYLPSPHSPGTFEIPVDADLPCWSPLIINRSARFTAGGIPANIEHTPNMIRAEWHGLPRSGTGLDENLGSAIQATRTMELRVERRTLVLDDEVSFERIPDAISWAIPETSARPLQVEMTANTVHSADQINVGGIGEWSSPFSGLARVHQLDVDPAIHVRANIRVTPLLRVGSTAHESSYDRSLYEAIKERVLATAAPIGFVRDHSGSLDNVDLLHLHWPEWFGFDDLAEHERLRDELEDFGIPIVWTAHNLTPHDRRPDIYDPIYAMWAATVDAVIHHSVWGKERMKHRYEFKPECRHEVIPHGHFGDLWSSASEISKGEAESRLGLPAAEFRLGMVGAPRVDKHTQAVLDGFAETNRDDIQLACWSLGYTERVPDDSRIFASRYREVDAATYALRLRSCDALIFPFDPDGEMLGTGTPHDAIGLGLPALISDWGYLTEVMGDAGIPCGHTSATIEACLTGLTRAKIEAAGTACRSLKAAYEWVPIANKTADLFDRVVLDEP